MKLWEPSAERISEAHSTAFIAHLNKQHSASLSGFHDLYTYSLRERHAFWKETLNFCDITFEGSNEPALIEGDHMLDSRWFPNVRLNYAENLLQNDSNGTAIVFRNEVSSDVSMSRAELVDAVRRVRAALLDFGVTTGDRVAGFLPNIPESIVAMLATSSIGAIWSSASPDFGVDGVLDRFGQIEPTVLFCADGYFYKEQFFSSVQKIQELQKKLPSLKQTILVPYTGRDTLPGEHVSYTDILQNGEYDQPLSFSRLPFDHPLFIMFSSGTTGKPKCIVHGAGGTLLEHKKEMLLHVDLKQTDRIFYATTCGWMMWNWLVSALSCGATVMLYDGFPMARNANVLFDYIDEQKISVFGTSAGFISAINKMDLKPASTHSLSSLHTILSTGSPLVPENFDYVYQSIKSDLCLSSISGGTDIIGCFALGTPTLPVHRGELQTRSLGYAVEVFSEAGEPVTGEKGELVCTSSFPSMPVGFWKDPDKKRYYDAYFSVYENVWRHGDYVELTENNGLVIYGRSDAVLNPGGVRIGTAEIYRQLEEIEEIKQGAVVGQQWKDDERVVLFVQLQDGVALTDSLKKRICDIVRNRATPRHVPKKIVQVPDIPVTRSGKISELAIKNLIHGKELANTEALANPDSLNYFRNVTELLTD